MRGFFVTNLIIFLPFFNSRDHVPLWNLLKVCLFLAVFLSNFGFLFSFFIIFLINLIVSLKDPPLFWAFLPQGFSSLWTFLLRSLDPLNIIWVLFSIFVISSPLPLALPLLLRILKGDLSKRLLALHWFVFVVGVCRLLSSLLRK